MPDSIFDFASQKGLDRPKSKARIPSIPQPTVPVDSLKTLEDMKVTYAKIVKQRDDIDNQLGTLFDRTGVNLKMVGRILNNPATYEGVNAKNYLEQREKYQEDIWRKTGQADKEKILAAQAKEQENRQKSKGVGARKRNWTFIR